MGNLPIQIYEYKKHDVIVCTVIKDTQSECGQPPHLFKSLRWSVYTETQPQSFKLTQGLQHFEKLRVFKGQKHQSSVSDKCKRSIKLYLLKLKCTSINVASEMVVVATIDI